MLVKLVVLALSWVALSGDASLASVAFGLALGALVVGLGGAAPRVRRRGLRPVRAAVRFALFVPYFVKELVLANLSVARSLLSPLARLRPAVVAIPLDLESDAEITMLANLITLTPGTLSLDVSADRKTLYVHVVHVDDVEALRRETKEGFERRVRELFA